MNLRHLTLTNFRSYRKESVALGQGIHFIIGQNGAGKTNFLEAIYMLALAKSHRGDDQVVIKHGEEFARIVADVEDHGRLVELSMVISKEGKSVSVNRVEQKRLSDYIGNLRIVSFLPEDTFLVTGSPRDRRVYFDVYLGQTDHDYIGELAKYKALLKQRNELLKMMQDSGKKDDLFLEVITAQLVDAARPVIQKRERFIAQINQFLEKEYRHLSGLDESCKVVYQPSTKDELEESYRSKLRADLFAQTTTVGPHRDDYDFVLAGVPAASHASGGQTRTMILALDMALCDMMSKGQKDHPIVLLDDVFSELDFDKQNRLIRYLKDLHGQVIITTTSTHDLSPSVLDGVRVYTVVKGTIKEEKTP